MAAADLGKRILVVVTSHDELGASGKRTGYWMGEVTHFHRYVSARGYQVDFASPKGGKPPLDERSRAPGDPDNRAFQADAEAVGRLDASLLPSALRASDYAAIYFAGGHGPMWDFPDHQAFQDLARSIYERGGVVAANCHGSAALVNLRLSGGSYLVEGKPVTGLSNFEEWLSGAKPHVPFLLEDELKKRGGQYRRALFPFASNVQVAERLVTGQNPRSTRAVAARVVELLA
jgi:putative intracellular protease/amidase